MIEFYKYHGTGNDFIMIDNREKVFSGDKVALARKWCDRRFGIGSDGLIFIENHPEHDFLMDFYNPDGSQSFCGNGSRCSMLFAQSLGIVNETAKFEAIDGVHGAIISDQGIKIKMADVTGVEQKNGDHFIDTGSPHYISYRVKNDEREIEKYGASIRFSEEYKKEGTNVNLIEILGDDRIIVETYERGVEAETFACGTGAVACGLSFGLLKEKSDGPVTVEVRGGQLTISFHREDESFSEVWLEGPAKFVYKGEIDG